MTRMASFQSFRAPIARAVQAAHCWAAGILRAGCQGLGATAFPLLSICVDMCIYMYVDICICIHISVYIYM